MWNVNGLIHYIIYIGAPPAKKLSCIGLVRWEEGRGKRGGGIDSGSGRGSFNAVRASQVYRLQNKKEQQQLPTGTAPLACLGGRCG